MIALNEYKVCSDEVLGKPFELYDGLNPLRFRNPYIHTLRFRLSVV